MIINSSTLQGLRTSFSALYQSAYDASPVAFDQVCSTVPTNTASVTYGFLSKVPIMRKWVGQRQLNNLKEQAAQIFVDDYESTIEVDRNDIEDDNLGVYSQSFQMLGVAAKKHPDQLLRAALQGGTSTNGFDGVPFFSTLHPLSGSNQSNNFTTHALNATNYADVRSLMMSVAGEDGEPLGVMPDLLIVPPQLEGTARLILNGDFISDGAGATITNVFKGSARLLVVPELANQGTTWYLACSNLPIKGLVFLQRKAPEFVQLTNSNDDNVFYNKKYVYGVDSRDAMGYGPWWLIARAIA